MAGMYQSGTWEKCQKPRLLPSAPHPAGDKAGVKGMAQSITGSLWQTEKASLEEKTHHWLDWGAGPTDE